MTAVNLKLTGAADYERQIARVLGSRLPHGYKKRFILQLCRMVVRPGMTDDDARERVIEIVEDGLQAAISMTRERIPAAPPQTPTPRPKSNLLRRD